MKRKSRTTAKANTPPPAAAAPGLAPALARRRRLKSLLPALLLLGLALLAYAPALGGGFIWDDDDYVTANANLRSLAGLARIWLEPRSSPQYYPLVHTSFWIEYQLWGLAAPGYHLVNVLLHAGAAVLLWRMLRRLEAPGALLAACAFAVHPVHAESVAWISERKNVLSMVFYLGAALAYVRWALAEEPSDEEQERLRRERSGGTPKPRFAWGRLYWISLGLCGAALLSKTVTCSLPAALLLVVWWKRGKLATRDVLPLAPMFVLGLVAALYTRHLELDHVRAVGPEWAYSPLDRVLIAGRALWFYAGKLVLPVDLSFVYPKWAIAPAVAWQWAFPVGAVVAVVALWLMRHRWGRGPLVAVLIFAGTLVPALGFFNIYPMRYALAADHFQYHASVALLALIAAGIDRVLRRVPAPARIGVVVAPLLVLTMIRSFAFADAERLWRDTLAKNPNSWMVHLNLARVLVERGGRDDEASHHFRRQAELAPQLPETHWNLGIDLARRGQRHAALAELDRAIALDPRFPQPYFERGNVYRDQGRLPEAESQYRRAIELKPDYAQAHFHLGLVREQQNDPDGAIQQYETAIKLRPGYARVHNQLGELFARRRDLPRAMEQFALAIESDPNFANAHFNAAAVLYAIGRAPEARESFEQAVRLDPSLRQYEGRVFGGR